MDILRSKIARLLEGEVVPFGGPKQKKPGIEDIAATAHGAIARQQELEADAADYVASALSDTAFNNHFRLLGMDKSQYADGIQYWEIFYVILPSLNPKNDPPVESWENLGDFGPVSSTALRKCVTGGGAMCDAIDSKIKEVTEVLVRMAKDAPLPKYIARFEKRETMRSLSASIRKAWSNSDAALKLAKVLA